MTTIRDAVRADLEPVQEIYAHHVIHGLASFEETAPDLAEIERRWRAATEAGLPYIVAELDGAVAGYAYCGAYRARPAYRHTVENTVYVAPDRTRLGLGRTLLSALIERCEGTRIRQMIAVIGDTDNLASIRLHESLGFRNVGTLKGVGFKHGRWVDSVLLQRAIGPGEDILPEK